ncbi:hypothetical protein BGZ79_006708 [Entomortierella chlamydospora]|nr:hypothetical protein BGZ79_006708 [Entomortierella chlamydospora]
MTRVSLYSSLRVTRDPDPHVDETPGNCVPALGEVFLKFFLAAYFFVSCQDETEDALITRIQNESSKADLASHISASGLVFNVRTGLYNRKFDDNVAATVFRDILGAVIVVGWLDYAIRAARSLVSYERLELLGDAVLEYVVAEYYYYKGPSVHINDFRKAKSHRLCNDAVGTLFIYLHLCVDEQVIRDGIAGGVAKMHDRITNGVRG